MKNDWEKEFDQQFTYDHCSLYEGTLPKEVKYFIKQLLTAQRMEIAYELKGAMSKNNMVLHDLIQQIINNLQDEG